MDARTSESDVDTVGHFGSHESIVMEKRQSVYQKDKRQVMRNVLIICVAWVFLFTAFQSLSNLQSSINRVEGLGTVGLAVIYGSIVLSCLVTPPALISRLGCKWTIVVSMVGYVIYMAANFKASWYTIIPGSVIIGFAAAPLWAAKCTYLTEIGVLYAQMNREDSRDVIARFFGIFFGFFQTSSIWGNLISSFILRQGSMISSNLSLEISHCGAYHCPSDDENNTNLKRPDTEKIYTLMGVYVALSVVAMGLICFLDNIKVDSESDATKFDPNTILATFHQMKRPYQILLIPITIYSGLQQGYIGSEFTKAYVSCALGIWMVGFVMICYGVCDAIGSGVNGKLHERIGRIPMFIGAAILQTGCLFTLLLWRPATEIAQRPIFFVISGCWGLCDSVWQTQINAFYGNVFPKKSEAAFANYRLWESAGFIMAFGYSSYFCVRVKTYTIWIVLIIGMVCYGVTEFLIKRERWREVKEAYPHDDFLNNDNQNYQRLTKYGD